MAKTKPATLTTKNAKSSSQKKKNFTSAPSSVQKTGPLPPLPPYFLFRRQFVERNQGIYPNLNKAATDAWRAMSDEEKSPWVEEAAKMREEHQKMYPGYRYTWKAKPKDQKQKKKKGKKSAKSGSEKTPVLGEGEDAWTTSQGLVSSPISDTGRSLYLSTMVDLEDLAGMPLNLVQTPTPGSWSGRQAYVTQPQPIGAFPTHIVQDDFAWCYDHRPVQIRPLLNGGRAFASVAQTQPEDIASPIIHHQAESTSGLTPAASGLSGNDRQAWVGQPQPQPQPHGVGISATYRRTSTSSFPAPCAPLDDRQISIGQPQVARMDLPSPYHQALASDFIPAAPPQYQAVNSLPIASLQRVPVSQVAGMPADLLAATRNWRPSAPSVCDTQPDFDFASAASALGPAYAANATSQTRISPIKEILETIGRSAPQASNGVAYITESGGGYDAYPWCDYAAQSQDRPSPQSDYDDLASQAGLEGSKDNIGSSGQHSGVTPAVTVDCSDGTFLPSPNDSSPVSSPFSASETSSEMDLVDENIEPLEERLLIMTNWFYSCP